MMPIEREDLAAALGLGPHELVSLVGGGGKTTLLFALSEQLAGRVVLSTTTKMAAESGDRVPVLAGPSSAELTEALAAARVVLVVARRSDSKLHGLAPDAVDRLFEAADHVLVEADGSRGRPAKAPAPHEPPIPERSTRVLAVFGADALGRVIADQCHRPLRVAAVAGCSPYRRLTPVGAARLLASERGMRKNVPDGCRFTVVVTKVDQHSRTLVDELAEALSGAGVEHVLVRQPTRPMDV